VQQKNTASYKTTLSKKDSGIGEVLALAKLEREIFLFCYIETSALKMT